MKNYAVDLEKKWDYENGFYLTCETSRIGKFLNHLEIYQQIIDLPGDILEFGVYKGTSIVRLLSFRDLLENASSRKVFGFDIFGKFPEDLELESDRKFVQQFEGAGGYGISRESIEGDILQTTKEYLQKNSSGKIALLHIDVDGMIMEL
ncbi:TylF/MycF/NovP-related O-methyltransferase [Flavihumibacter sp. UBA7668]|uniref:TylF/MycF/NovP-related O-methyltransferase n=1 Tax=Flavihumibacter sp. UBA7668 TaxID=1946542 RepID=UPI0025C2EF47|nr:TylF/MycF/NovP-related O-methyltransferase [Flavihumibacter sp. UBA7668]